MNLETPTHAVLKEDQSEAMFDALARFFEAEPWLLEMLDQPSVRAMTVGEVMRSLRLRVPEGHAAHPHLQSIEGSRKERSTIENALSDRELEVVRLIVEGLSNKEISLRLSVSDKTVKNHISHILAKLHLTARTQVAVLALRAGIV